MPEEGKSPYVHAKIDPKLMELFLGLEERVGLDEKHDVQEILGELKIGHQEEAKNLFRYFKAKKEAKIESKKKLTDELEMAKAEIERTKRILNSSEYKKQHGVYEEILGKYEKERDDLLKKVEQAKEAAAELPSIEEIEKKLEEQ